jgi:tryptophan synthase alpha chain
MSRFEAMFSRLASRGEHAFVPYCVLGDPTPAESLAILEALCDGGADALELGIPFSDPVADGPTIQAAATRALAAGTRPADALALIAELRHGRPEIPIGLLVYANLLEARGMHDFYARAQAAGVDAVLVADVPTVEAAAYLQAAAAHGIDAVMIATPNASHADLATIASMSRGFTYVVSRVGVTGADNQAGGGQDAMVERLRENGAPPCLIGFGISTPEQVRAACATGAAGAISGSAVVRIIAETEAAERSDALTAFVRKMKQATR